MKLIVKSKYIKDTVYYYSELHSSILWFNYPKTQYTYKIYYNVIFHKSKMNNMYTSNKYHFYLICG